MVLRSIQGPDSDGGTSPLSVWSGRLGVLQRDSCVSTSSVPESSADVGVVAMRCDAFRDVALADKIFDYIATACLWWFARSLVEQTFRRLLRGIRVGQPGRSRTGPDSARLGPGPPERLASTADARAGARRGELDPGPQRPAPALPSAIRRRCAIGQFGRGPRVACARRYLPTFVLVHQSQCAESSFVKVRTWAGVEQRLDISRPMDGLHLRHLLRQLPCGNPGGAVSKWSSRDKRHEGSPGLRRSKERRAALIGPQTEARFSQQWFDDVERYADLPAPALCALLRARRDPLMTKISPRLYYRLDRIMHSVGFMRTLRHQVGPMARTLYGKHTRRKGSMPAP